MKHNWEYKPLANLCNVFVDGDWIESKDQSDSGIRLIQTGNVGNGEYLDKSDKSKFISEDTFHSLNCTEIFEGDILISRLPDPIGRACILPQLSNRAITAVDVAIVRPSSSILPSLIVHYTKSKAYASYIDVFTKGSTRKRVSRKNLGSIKFPVPPMEVQEQIVAELDSINGMIEKNREVLRTLDALTQSLFYDTFGDPITNPKRWEIKTIKDIFSLKAGKAIKAEELSNSPNPTLYPCYGGNGIRGYIERYSHSGLYNIIGRQGALCGNITLASGDFYATEHAVVVTPKVKSSALWIYYVLTEYNLNRYAKGVAQPGLSVSVINDLQIPVPPLALQEAFAKKIEAIEEQKAKVEAATARLQTLLDSRMDYWFN